MVASMTAFARAQRETALGPLVIEVKSVNHRYLELHFKLPDQLRSLESQWREQARTALTRGKIDIFARFESHSPAGAGIAVNEELVTHLVEAARTVAHHVDNAMPLNPLEILRWPGVVAESRNGDNQEDAFAQADQAFASCLTSLSEGRTREGSALQATVEQKLDEVDDIVATCRAEQPKLLELQYRRMRERIEQLALDTDGDRLEQELVLLANKSDVVEELDRLAAHSEEIRRILASGGPCGRRLDFLMQELNREANTLSAKAIALSNTRNAVELKVLIEQMREQIQNIE